MKLAKSQLPKITPQSKHFAVKYHWFRERLVEYGFDILERFGWLPNCQTARFPPITIQQYFFSSAIEVSPNKSQTARLKLSTKHTQIVLKLGM